MHTMNKLHFSAFLRGYWDSVQFGYVPDYDTAELQVWAAGLQWGNAGKGEPSVEDFDELCDTHNTQ